jgi:hypothetical protein
MSLILGDIGLAAVSDDENGTLGMPAPARMVLIKRAWGLPTIFAYARAV